MSTLILIHRACYNSLQWQWNLMKLLTVNISSLLWCENVAYSVIQGCDSWSWELCGIDLLSGERGSRKGLWWPPGSEMWFRGDPWWSSLSGSLGPTCGERRLVRCWLPWVWRSCSRQSGVGWFGKCWHRNRWFEGGDPCLVSIRNSIFWWNISRSWRLNDYSWNCWNNGNSEKGQTC